MLSVQCKMARVALGLGVREVAELAKLSPDTIARFERGEPLKERTVKAIQHALERAGVVFVPENGDGPGVRLRKGHKTAPAAPQPRPGDSAEIHRSARRSAGKAVDEALANSPASDDEKAKRKRQLTKVPKALRGTEH